MKSRRVGSTRGFTKAYAVSQPVRCKTKLTLGWHGQTPRNRAIECPMDAARGVCPCRRNREKARASVAPYASFHPRSLQRDACPCHPTQARLIDPAPQLVHDTHGYGQYNVIPCILGMCGILLSIITPQASAGGFDYAFHIAQQRVVKLYGMGAGQQVGYGTGMIASEDGYIVTVLSLLVSGNRIRAVTANGSRYEADLIKRDADRQLALLKLKWPEDVHQPLQDKPIGPLPFFDFTCDPAPQAACHEPLLPGDWILAAGNPFKIANGSEQMSLAHGVFSVRTRLDARRRTKDFPYTGDVLVIDAITSNPGSPGSAMVNLQGELVGMIGRLVISNRTHTHLNYAIPYDVLADFFKQATQASNADMAKTTIPTEVEAFDTGIRISRTGYRTILPFVDRVVRNSPAQRAGLRKDDLILSVNDHEVSDVSQFDKRMNVRGPAETVELIVLRGRSIVTIHIEAPEAKKAP